MAHEVIEVDDAVICIRLTGLMQIADQEALQALACDLIEQGKKVKVLAIAENFQGWERKDDWGDVGFLMEHGDDIVKMAIVGDERWKEEAFLFVGKGLRRTEIEFFPSDARSEAECWLRSDVVV
jgi:hypothetical protein